MSEGLGEVTEENHEQVEWGASTLLLYATVPYSAAHVLCALRRWEANLHRADNNSVR
jgi:hypothetical protein